MDYKSKIWVANSPLKIVKQVETRASDLTPLILKSTTTTIKTLITIQQGQLFKVKIVTANSLLLEVLLLDKVWEEELELEESLAKAFKMLPKLL